MKKVMIVYFSATGNTAKIAKAMAPVLKAKLKKVQDVKPVEVAKYDLIGFGSGIYAMKPSPALLDFIDKMPCAKKRQKTFIFSTRGGGPAWLYHRALRKKLEEKGFEIAGEFSCKGHDTFWLFNWFGGLNKGKPGKEEIHDAKSFARLLSSFSKV